MAAHTKKYIGAISYSQDTIAVTNSENIVASGVEPRVGKRRVGGAGRGRVGWVGASWCGRRITLRVSENNEGETKEEEEKTFILFFFFFVFQPNEEVSEQNRK